MGQSSEEGMLGSQYRDQCSSRLWARNLSPSHLKFFKDQINYDDKWCLSFGTKGKNTTTVINQDTNCVKQFQIITKGFSKYISS